MNSVYDVEDLYSYELIFYRMINAKNAVTFMLFKTTEFTAVLF